MLPIVLHTNDYTHSQWEGGRTTQLLLLPQSASYALRNYDIRISKATVVVEESVFTQLPGISRKLVLLNGNLHLSLSSRAEKDLRPGNQLSFEGEEPVFCRGTGTDFNVMVRRGLPSEVYYQTLHAGERIEVSFDAKNQLAFLYVYSGVVEISWGELSTELLADMSCYVLQMDRAMALQIKANEACCLLLTEVWNPN